MNQVKSLKKFNTLLAKSRCWTDIAIDERVPIGSFNEGCRPIGTLECKTTNTLAEGKTPIGGTLNHMPIGALELATKTRRAEYMFRLK